MPFFLAGGPALIEGRGERVTPLRGIHGHPGVLLVTPAIALRTPDVFAVFDGIRGGGHGDGAVRMTSEHLAQELGNGLSAADLLARAGVLASANDLLRGGRGRGTRARRRPAGPDPAAGPPDRPVRLRPDPVGALSFARRGDEAAAVVRGRRRRRHDPDDRRRPAVDHRHDDPHANPDEEPPHDPTGRHDVRAPRARSAPYSQAIVSGDFVFCSGQLGLDPATGELVEGGVEAQAERALRNLAAVLDAAGVDLGRRGQDDVFLADIDDFAAVNAVYARYMPDPPPARSTFAVGALPEGRPGRDRGHRPARLSRQASLDAPSGSPIPSGDQPMTPTVRPSGTERRAGADRSAPARRRA